ncbi:baculoviral IAP repeat-containing protein 2-like, partial [Lingula anatina]|uniref:Baculoviral IAP repeat-containing protein 2-like n=1 Tax=Lingula anatina TaxID=7574 RepID=A0A1S3IS41_LINAN
MGTEFFSLRSVPPEIEGAMCDSHELNREPVRLHTFKEWPDWVPVPGNELASAGFHYLGIEDAVACYSCQCTIKDWREGDDINMRHVEASPFCSFLNNIAPKQGTTIFTDMKLEENRLHTFGRWPPYTSPNPRELAKAGFCDIGEARQVQCPFCGCTLQLTDFAISPFLPFNLHAQQSPSCPFVREKEKHNIPLDIDDKRGCAVIKPGRLLAGPVYPRFSDIDSRQETFETWPFHLPTLPNKLQTAGFFYRGFSDNVTCFYCGGQLRNWENNGGSLTNIAWIEHARWLPRCPFLLLKKGPEFVDMVQTIYPPKIPDDNSRGNEAYTAVRSDDSLFDMARLQYEIDQI